MKVVILQSSYIPWKGYFDLIHDADLFIFLDDVQYTPRDWRSRNQIKTPQGIKWLTIPVGAKRSRLINEVNIPDIYWQKRHFKTLEFSYQSCQFYKNYESLLKEIYLERRWKNLSDLNQFIIKEVSHGLSINTRFTTSSEFKVSGQKQSKILGLLKECGATSYISGSSAKTYLKEDMFLEADIELVWKDYSGYPEYIQPFPPFVHNVSIFDLLFNTGITASDYIWGWRQTQ